MRSSVASALATDSGHDLLFKGSDFLHTDIDAAVTAEA